LVISSARYSSLFQYIGTYDIYRVFGTLGVVMESKSKRILGLAAKRQIIRSKDASALGVPRNYLSRFVEKGLLRKVGRGLYTSTSSSATEHLSLIEAAYKVPAVSFVFFPLFSFIKFTTQAPHQIWMAIDVKAWTRE